MTSEKQSETDTKIQLISEGQQTTVTSRSSREGDDEYRSMKTDQKTKEEIEVLHKFSRRFLTAGKDDDI